MRRSLNKSVKWKKNPLQPWIGWARYNKNGEHIHLNGYIDVGKCHFAERLWFERGALTRKGLIMESCADRYWYPTQPRFKQKYHDRTCRWLF